MNAFVLILALAGFDGGIQEVEDLIDDGRYRAAETAARELVAEATTAKSDEMTRARALEKLTDALLSNAKHRYPETLELAEETLALFKKRTKKKDPARINVLWNRAMAHLAHEETDEAFEMMRRAVELAEKAYGEEDPRTAEWLLAWSGHLTGERRFDEAREALERVERIHERHADTDRTEIAWRLDRRADLLSALGQDAEAAEAYRAALDAYRDAYRPGHPLVANAIAAVGNVLLGEGKYEEALPVFEQALEIRRAELRPTHPSIANSLGNLGTLFHAIGRLDQARAAFEHQLELQRQEPHTSELAIASTLADLGALDGAFEQWEVAIDRVRQAIEIVERHLGSDHPNLVVLLNNLGALHAQSGAPEKGFEFIERALAIQEQQLGSAHPEVARMMTNLASLYNEAGDMLGAQMNFTLALAKQYTGVGRDHPDVSMTLTALSTHLERRGRTQAAESMMRRSLEQAEQHFEPAHPVRAHGHLNFALLLERQGEYDEAEAQLRKARTAWVTIHGETHPAVAMIDERLAAIASRPEETEEAAHASLPHLAVRFGTPPGHVEADDPVRDPNCVKAYTMEEAPGASYFRVTRYPVENWDESLEERAAHNLHLIAKRFPDADFSGVVLPDWALQPFRRHDVPYIALIAEDNDDKVTGDTMMFMFRTRDEFWAMSWITMGKVLTRSVNVFAEFIGTVEIVPGDAAPPTFDRDVLMSTAVECLELLSQARGEVEEKGYTISACTQTLEGKLSLFGSPEGGLDIKSFRTTLNDIHGLDAFSAVIYLSRENIDRATDVTIHTLKLHFEHRDGWCRDLWLPIDETTGAFLEEGSREARADCVVLARDADLP